MKHQTFKIAAMFSLAVFIVITVTMAIIGSIGVTLIHFGIAQDRNPIYMVLAFMLVSIVVGTGIAILGSKRTISPILQINDATKKIAKGDFDIQLNIDGPARELNEMGRNFTIMAKELAQTETFHNDFINNVSHEFKTPLSAIEGYATLLQNRNLTEENRQQYVSKIIYNTKRLTALTGNILQLTQLENQSILTGRSWFSLDEQLRENVLLFDKQWTEKDLELNIELESVNYYGSSDLLSQVWLNLISNAVKFAPKAGFIYVTLKQADTRVIVTVTDNGIGMNADVQQRIFDKFYQGDSSHSAKGNGLGLTLTKRIVDLHGGKIAVSSQEGKGTTFTVTLPIEKPDS